MKRYNDEMNLIERLRSLCSNGPQESLDIINELKAILLNYHTCEMGIIASQSMLMDRLSTGGAGPLSRVRH